MHESNTLSRRGAMGTGAGLVAAGIVDDASYANGQVYGAAGGSGQPQTSD